MQERLKAIGNRKTRIRTILASVLLVAGLVVVTGGFAGNQAKANTNDPPVPDSPDTNEGLLQFTSAGYVLGFDEDGVIVASASHMLRIDFLDDKEVYPESNGEISGASDTGAVSPLGTVTFRNLWDGVTVVYEGGGDSIVKSTYYITPAANGIPVDGIRLGYNRPVRIDDNGNLVILYEDGTMIERAPVAWQETGSGKKPVTVQYVLRGENEVGFALGDYIPGIPVVIDPELTWNTFLGGAGNDYGKGITVDSSGNIYITGQSDASWGSPVRAYTSSADDKDAFAVKLDSSGNLVWNTFLGGTGDDGGYGIAVDGSGNVYIGGLSKAAWGSPVRAYSSDEDAFAAKLDSSGNLTWNTFLGTSNSDYGFGIALDSSGNVYVGGYSWLTWGSPVRAKSGGWDAFAARLDSSGDLQWNTFLGGTGTDNGYGIAADSGGNVYIVGRSSAAWGTPVSEYTSSGFDILVAKLNSSGILQWNTFLGSSSSDQGWGIAADSGGNVYIAGYCGASWGSPVRAYYGSGYDAFAAKLNSNGTLAWNSFIGGSGIDHGYDVAADGNGNVYVTGHSDATWGSPDRAHYGSGNDVYAVQLDSSGNLTWNTFLGGSGYEDGKGITADNSGTIYVTATSGATWGSPVRAYYGSTNDAFAVKLTGFEPVPPLTGDVNEDGEVDVADITKTARVILMLDSETPGSDVNQDGTVNVQDMTKIARIILGLE